MKNIKRLLLLSFLFIFGFACNADRDEYTIEDLESKGVDTSTLGSTTTDSDALGSNKIDLAVAVGSGITASIGKVQVRAFTSRSPLIASSWQILTLDTSDGQWKGTYDAAPDSPTAFGMHIQAFEGSTKVVDQAGSESEYDNLDASAANSPISGNLITLTTQL